MRNVDEINIYIYKLWRSQCIKINENIPLPGFVREPTKRSILFLGMNPSFNKDGYKSLLEKSKKEWIKNLDFNKFIHHDYNLNLKNTEILELVEKVNEVDDAIGNGGHVYLKTLTEKIINKVGISPAVCNFWDIFCFRGNNQDEFLEKYIFNAIRGTKKDQINFFGLKQIILLLKIIELCEPKVIVFPNKGAVDRLVEIFSLFGKEIGFNERLGTHYIKINGIKYPIFFSSNLHLRNRLDRYSQDRLGWHVKWVFNQVE